MLRKLRQLLFSLLALIIILLATISALVETETGSRWVVARLAALVDLQVGKVSGNLRRGLDLEFIEYQTSSENAQPASVRAEQISFRWRPVDLLYGALAIQSFSVKKVRVNLPPVADEQSPAAPFNQWPHLRLPIRVHLDQFLVQDIEYRQADTRLHWHTFSGSISWGTFHARYHTVKLVSDDYELLLSGSTALAFPYATQAELDWQWQAAANELQAASGEVPLQYKGTSQLNGNLRSLQLHNQTSLPVVLTADAQLPLVDEQNFLQLEPAINLQLAWEAQTLPSQWWMPQQAVPVTSGKVNAQGNWKHYTVELQGDIHLPDAPALAINGVAAGDLEKIQIDNLQIRELVDTGAAQTPEQGLTLAGNVRWLPQLQWQLDANAKRLNTASIFENWASDINASFNTTGQYQYKEKTLSAAVDNLKLSGVLRGVNLFGDGSARFDGKQLHTPGLNIILGANQLHMKGELGNSVGLEWTLKAPLLQQIDESLHGSIQSQGALRGSWKKPQVQMTAAAEQFRWGDYAVDKLDFSLAPKNPQTSLEASQDSTGIGSAELLGSDLLSENYQLVFNANQLRIGSNRFSSIQLNGDGSFNQHQLQALVKSVNYGRADFLLSGNYDGDEWRGQFKRFSVKVKKVPRWWMTSSKPIRVTDKALMLGAQCFTTRTNLTAAVERADHAEREEIIGEWVPNQSPAKAPYDWLLSQKPLPASGIERYSLPQLCLRGDWSVADGAKFIAQLDSVPLRQFLSLFKTEVYFAGVMDGSFHFSAKQFTLAEMTADANITTRNAELRYQYAGGTTEVYAWRNFNVSAALAKAKLDAHAGMEWVGYGQINADTQLDLAQQKINRAELHATFSNLAPLETLLSFANDVKGNFQADLSAGGSFQNPYLTGEMSLRNGSANLPRLGVDLTNIEVQVNANRTGNVNWMGQMQSGKGRLSIVGDLNQFATPDWNMQAYVNGTDFQVVALQELKATLTPNIKITANKNAMDITGDAVIPWARANIKSLPASATQVSSDVVVIDENYSSDVPRSPMEISANLNLSLGDDVSFKGFGLISKLSGKVNLLKEPQRQFFTSGYVSVADGSYKAYGQTLTIERGRLLFQGPYENPGVEIRASRIIRGEEDISVGLEITGTLQRPKATVYTSGKGVSDSQAMRMLLTGKAANEEFTKGDASILLSAMGGLGGDSGDGLSASINEFLHVDELELKSDQGFDQSELWIGKYITPKLLVRYVVGIFNKAFSLGFEYQLTERLRVEAQSGEAQSMDVIYKIEK